MLILTPSLDAWAAAMQDTPSLATARWTMAHPATVQKGRISRVKECAKMAMAGAGGLALGAGAVFAAEHAGDIAQFAEGAFDDVGHFAGDAAHGVEEFVEDIF
ncbi:unnamed protein product [Symbiodinium sp. CCMP2456]|nr:unnamed protein product [Symbiodinium sp. CCMP2456]